MHAHALTGYSPAVESGAPIVPHFWHTGFIAAVGAVQSGIYKRYYFVVIWIFYVILVQLHAIKPDLFKFGLLHPHFHRFDLALQEHDVVRPAVLQRVSESFRLGFQWLLEST